MSGLINELEALGCSMQDTMERFLDNEELYHNCLTKALTDESFAGLENALKEKDIKAGFEHAHNLKGLMANMGLTPVFDEVVEIVEPLRMGVYSDELMSHYEKMMKEIEKVAEISRKYN